MISLDVFRGLVILAMLIVNNIGDSPSTGYFWKHADWPQMTWSDSWRLWWQRTTHRPVSDERREQAAEEENKRELFVVLNGHPGRFEFYRAEEAQRRIKGIEKELGIDTSNVPCPLFSFCTLADYVMPSFMLIIGVAIPFSVAAAMRRGTSPRAMWIRVVRRAAVLVVLGWVLCYFRDQFAYSLYGKMPWRFSLGMDVLQLLGIGYLVARLIFVLPTIPRFAFAAILLIYHWALLRFYPQTPVPAGAFFPNLNALQNIYSHWSFLQIGPVSIGARGLLSVIPAAAIMVLGTLIGDWLRREEVLPVIRAKRLALAGGIGMVLGFLWAFSLPFNKPCWTPSYLVYVSGVDAVCIALLYWLIDIRNVRRWCYPLIVFGTNALAIYFLSILCKVLLLNTPQIHGARVIDLLLSNLKSTFGLWTGGWMFTISYIGFWWIVMEQFYRRKIFIKL